VAITTKMPTNRDPQVMQLLNGLTHMAAGMHTSQLTNIKSEMPMTLVHSHPDKVLLPEEIIDHQIDYFDFKISLI